MRIYTAIAALGTVFAGFWMVGAIAGMMYALPVEADAAATGAGHAIAFFLVILALAGLHSKADKIIRQLRDQATAAAPVDGRQARG